MAEVQPLRGWRYDLGHVGSLADVVAPPYDVINDVDQKALYELHPCNVVRLILNRDEPGDDSESARYDRAAGFLRQWKADGILQQEHEDAFYVYHQEFEWEGTTYNRKGFLGRIRLEEFGKGQVYPHEQTMSGPKADRLNLTKACKTNLSPIFGLYPDDAGAAQAPLEEAIRSETPLEVTDDLDVKHRMWVVSNRDAINAVREALLEKPIFIADGHHRYETAVNYRNHLKETGELTDDSHPANFVLMHFVGMSDPGLAILPTHRMVTGVPNMSMDELTAALSGHFEIGSTGTGPDAARETWALMDADGDQGVFGFGTASDNQWVLARVKDASPMKDLCPDQSDAWRELGVSLLHKLVLEHLVAKAFNAEPKCRYVHLMDEVNEGLAGDEYPLACLVAPAGIDHVREIASAFEKMPPKSTFFYPKLLSGLVLNPLD